MEYNVAVDELFDSYLQRNKITPEQMTPVQAREFLSEVLWSEDDRIVVYRQKIMSGREPKEESDQAPRNRRTRPARGRTGGKGGGDEE
jgi:hypothetical protein